LGNANLAHYPHDIDDNQQFLDDVRHYGHGEIYAVMIYKA
jgi:hypothetical protein